MTNNVKARQMALDTAKLNGIPESKVRHCVDTQFPGHPACYVVDEHPDSATIIYVDDWNTTVATGNHKGRFVETKETNNPQ